MSAGKLTAKQEAFVREYLVDKNATQAAIRAGYSVKAARQVAAETLSNPSVRAAVNAGLRDLAARVGITSEMVLRERKRIAFFDPRKLMDSEGNPLPIQDLDDDTAAAIAGLEVVQMTGAGEIPGVMSLVKKYRLAAKDTSLAALEKYLGLNEKPVRFALPKIDGAEDCAKAQGAVLHAVANGDLLPSEAKVLADLIEGQRRAFETTDLAKRLADIEEQLNLKGQRP